LPADPLQIFKGKRGGELVRDRGLELKRKKGSEGSLIVSAKEEGLGVDEAC